MTSVDWRKEKLAATCGLSWSGKCETPWATLAGGQEASFGLGHVPGRVRTPTRVPSSMSMSTSLAALYSEEVWLCETLIVIMNEKIQFLSPIQTGLLGNSLVWRLSDHSYEA